MYVRMYVQYIRNMYLYICCMYVHMNVCMWYVRMFVHTYMHTYMHSSTAFVLQYLQVGFYMIGRRLCILTYGCTAHTYVRTYVLTCKHGLLSQTMLST